MEEASGSWGEEREEKEKRDSHTADRSLHTDQCIAFRKSKMLLVIFSGFWNVPILVHLARCCVHGIFGFFLL